MPARLNSKMNGSMLCPKLRPECDHDPSKRGNAGPWKAWERRSNCLSHPSHRPWKSIKPISTFPHHDYDEDEYFLKPAGLRDTYSEGKVILTFRGIFRPIQGRPFFGKKATSFSGARFAAGNAAEANDQILWRSPRTGRPGYKSGAFAIGTQFPLCHLFDAEREPASVNFSQSRLNPK